jgi:GT2 family glycosyltransferase
VSLVTVTFNAARFIEACLTSVAAIRYPALEVLVVDNASTDGTPNLVRRGLPQGQLIESPRNLGFAGANNLAVGRATGDVLLFLNPDTLPPPETVEALCLPVWQEATLGATGCKLVYPDGRIQSAGGVLDAGGHCAHRGYREPDRGEYDVPAEVDYLPAAALAIRRALFVEVGGFHEGYFPGFYEDVELCLRLRRAGYRVRYLPRPAIVHLESPSMERAYRYWMQRNRLLFLARNAEGGTVLAELVREGGRLLRDDVRPVLTALGRRPWRLRAEWQRVRPVLAGSVAALPPVARALLGRGRPMFRTTRGQSPRDPRQKSEQDRGDGPSTAGAAPS